MQHDTMVPVLPASAHIPRGTSQSRYIGEYSRSKYNVFDALITFTSVIEVLLELYALPRRARALLRPPFSPQAGAP
jgi:hypothetical protein